MLFISNDFKSLFINESDRYSKRHFVIIRKLFVTPKTEGPFDEGFIRLNLKIFGDIEEIEMLLFGKPEAYVTFTKSSSAYDAVADSKNMATENMNPFHIVPADTWVQPIETTDEPTCEDEEPPIFVLNDDCLEHIFRYLDAPSLIDVSDVCKRFRTVTKPLLSRVRELEFVVPNGVSLSIVRRYLKHVGNYIETISFFSKSGPMLFHSKNRWIEKLAQYTGPQLRKASFRYMLKYERQLEILRPMMQNLKELQIYESTDDSDDIDDSNIFDCIDIMDLCPKLTLLHVNTWPFRHNKPFPSLQIFKYSGAIMDDIEFFHHNPQLREIHFYFGFFHDIEELVTYLPNIEKYTAGFPDPSMIESLSRLDKLNSLTLLFVEPGEVIDLLKNMTNMVNLKELKVFFQNGKSFSTQQEREAAQVVFLQLAEALPNLETLLIGLFDICADTIVEFIRKARRLRTIHLNLNVDDLAIKNIAEIISNRKPIEKFTVFVDNETFNSLSLSIANDPEISRTLNICIYNFDYDFLY